MPTNRTPRYRADRVPMVSDVAIELYRRGKALMRRKQTEEVHNELVRVWNALHLELQLRPWQRSPLDVHPDDELPPNANAIQVESWHRSHTAHSALEQGVRELRRREREARRAKAAPASPPPESPASPTA